MLRGLARELRHDRVPAVFDEELVELRILVVRGDEEPQPV